MPSQVSEVEIDNKGVRTQLRTAEGQLTNVFFYVKEEEKTKEVSLTWENKGTYVTEVTFEPILENLVLDQDGGVIMLYPQSHQV